jgi:hypothetical protein
VSNDGVEACDWLDNDCDGQTDEDFPELDTACSNGSCQQGLWICDPDSGDVICDGPVPAERDASCDGIDEDCDGQTDEDAPEAGCPLELGVCAGTSRVCLPGGVYAECYYGLAYTAGRDAICDGLDNDCDGATDEDGVLRLEPETGAATSDGIDNNCNGLTDEPGGLMVQVPGSRPVWIDAYEITVFESADCSGARYGEASADYPAGWPAVGDADVSLFACSMRGLIPSGYLSWHQARRACEAQGKRLCTSDEQGSACNAGLSTWYPYGQAFSPGGCNDALSGAGQALPAGEKSGCTAGNGTFDMSGNLAEWLSEWDLARPGNAYVGGYGYERVLCETGLGCTFCPPGDLDCEATIKIISDCNLQQGHPYESFATGEQLAFIGARCCLDGPEE